MMKLEEWNNLELPALVWQKGTGYQFCLVDRNGSYRNGRGEDVVIYRAEHGDRVKTTTNCYIYDAYELVPKPKERWVCLRNLSVVHETDSEQSACKWASEWCKTHPMHEVLILKAVKKVTSKSVERKVIEYVEEIKDV